MKTAALANWLVSRFRLLERTTDSRNVDFVFSVLNNIAEGTTNLCDTH